jgi:8-oxo-dGTP diphosphatase
MPVEEQGVQPERYQIIPRVLVFATRADQVLLLKGASRKRVWPNRYNGVGGHVERGEDVLTAARREFHEETGLELRNAWLAAIVMIDTQQPTGISLYVFRGTAGSGELIASEEGSLHWVKQAEIANLELVEDLPILLPKTLALKPGEEPLFAQYTYTQEGNLRIVFSNE